MERTVRAGIRFGHRVLGTDDTIIAPSRATRCETYFDRRYSADNTVLALAGNIDIDRVAGLASSLCASWRNTGATRDVADPGRNNTAFEMRDETVSRAYMLMLGAAPSIDEERRHAARLLSQVLGAPGNSRLHWALIETGLAEEAQAAYSPHDGTGEFMVYASGDPDRLDEIRSTIEGEIRSLVDSITEDDLARLRSKLATSVTTHAERANDRMQRIGQWWTYTRSYTTLEQELERIERVTLGELREVFEAFPLTECTTGTLLPAQD
jgi:predicted Zn-dependent peptidase